MTLSKAQKTTLRRVGLFATIYLAVFMIILWAGIRAFPAQDSVANKGIQLYLDHIAIMTMKTLFWPFYSLGYKFISFFGALLWFVVAAFWSTLIFFIFFLVVYDKKTEPSDELNG